MKRAPLNEADLHNALQSLPRWHHNHCIPAIEAAFHFPNESTCLQYLDALSAAADRIDHHPQILHAGNAVTLRWWTHSIKAITAADIEAAQLSEALAQPFL